MKKVTIEILEKYLADRYKGWATDQRMLLKLVEEHNIDFPYKTIREYILQTYDAGEEIYSSLCERYEEEILYYSQEGRTFEDMFGSLEFR